MMVNLLTWSIDFCRHTIRIIPMLVSWISINLTWFVEFEPAHFVLGEDRVSHHISVSWGKLISFLLITLECLEELSGEESFLFSQARQSITICLVNYCWHILADASIFVYSSVLETMTQQNFNSQCQEMRRNSREEKWWFHLNHSPRMIRLMRLSIFTIPSRESRTDDKPFIEITPHYQVFRPVSDIMTHLFIYFISDRFVSLEVILIKYFYISTEIFSCHYDMMNYITGVHKFCYSHWWLYFVLLSQNDKRNALWTWAIVPRCLTYFRRLFCI